MKKALAEEVSKEVSLSNKGQFSSCFSYLRLWQGCQDSNLGMPESKSGALPLGDTPKREKLNNKLSAASQDFRAEKTATAPASIALTLAGISL